MKYLLIFAIVAWLAWRWRSSRFQSRASAQSKSDGAPTDMQRCNRCGLHVPTRESITGKSGFYCCQEHLQQAES